MVDEAVAEMASDFAKCKCVATAPQCPTPQQRWTLACLAERSTLERKCPPGPAVEFAVTVTLASVTNGSCVAV
jgi:hypothetical protein